MPVLLRWLGRAAGAQARMPVLLLRWWGGQRGAQAGMAVLLEVDGDEDGMEHLVADGLTRGGIVAKSGCLTPF
jgi:hypothetical protein